MGAYFEPLGDGVYRPAPASGGAWNDDEIHFSPLGGLLVHAMDQHRDDDGSGKALGRISFDILGMVPFDDCTIGVETTRAGRTIELVEAVAIVRGRRVATARAWFVSPVDTGAVAAGAPYRMPPSDAAQLWPMDEVWSGGYVASLEVRAVEPPLAGRARVWMRSSVDLVEDEVCSTHASYIALVDTANGIAVRENPSRWMFPNLDLTIHLHRQPVGEWIGLDTTVVFGPTGLGITSSVLYDASGAVGRAEQALTVRPVE